MIKSSVIDKLYEADLCQAIGRVYTDASYKIRNNGGGVLTFQKRTHPQLQGFQCKEYMERLWFWQRRYEHYRLYPSL